MSDMRHSLIGFLTKKSNRYSMLMVLTTLVFLASMAAGTAALPIWAHAEAPPQANLPGERGGSAGRLRVGHGVSNDATGFVSQRR